MHDTIIQTLLTTRIEHPIDGDDVDEWVDRLTTLGEEVSTIRDSDDPTLLTENEAEVIVRWHGMGQSAKEIAEAMGVGTQRVYDLRYAAEEDLLAADATLSIIHDLRERIRPDLYNSTTEKRAEGSENTDHPQPAFDVLCASEIPIETYFPDWRPFKDGEPLTEYDVRDHPEVWDDRTLPRHFRNLSDGDYVASYRLPEPEGEVDDRRGINLQELAVRSTIDKGKTPATKRVTYNPETFSAVVYRFDEATALITHNGVVAAGKTVDSTRTAIGEAIKMIATCEIGLNSDREEIPDTIEVAKVGEVVSTHSGK